MLLFLIDQLEEDVLEKTLQNLKAILKDMKPASKTWTERQSVAEENWQSTRPDIFKHIIERMAIPDVKVCMKCEAEMHASISCTDCGLATQGIFLCSTCDKETHRYEPFHMRQMWLNGYWERVPAGFTVVEDDEHEGVWKLGKFGKLA